MQKITTFLTYRDQAAEAAAFYVSLFPGSKILSTMPGPGGSVMTVQFELFGQKYIALNGGPTFSFSEGFSFLVSCESQAEIDELWTKLTADGGEESRCGWCKDKFGVSWQIIPRHLPQLLSSPKAVQAMLGMNKLDIAALERAGE
jgi:predicted 3-demethylubiquinone-9 3-methyltransferase (glyoxalase superfamily)